MRAVFGGLVIPSAMLWSLPASAADWRYLGRASDGIVFVDVESAVADKNKHSDRPPYSGVGYTALFVQRWSISYNVPEVQYASYVLAVDADCLTRKSRVKDLGQTWDYGEFVPTLTRNGRSDVQELSLNDGKFGAVFNSMCGANLNKLFRVKKPNLIGAAMLRYNAAVVSDLPGYELKIADSPETLDELPYRHHSRHGEVSFQPGPKL